MKTAAYLLLAFISAMLARDIMTGNVLIEYDDLGNANCPFCTFHSESLFDLNTHIERHSRIWIAFWKLAHFWKLEWRKPR